MNALPICLELEDGIAHMILDAPPRNVMDGRFFDALGTIAREVLPGLDVKGLVIRGRGRHFSAGADVAALRKRACHRIDVLPGSGNDDASGQVLPELRSLPDPVALSDLHRNAVVFTAIEQLRYPTVAAVDGACLGSGLELALACRWRLATPSTLMAAPEAAFGLIPGCGGTVRLPQRVGLGAALDLLLTARFVDATEALELGLVDAIVPRGELAQAAVRLVLRLAEVTGGRA
jgi:enoyl-CoA hydratase/carnithine racemase